MLAEAMDSPNQEQVIHDFKGSSSRFSRKLRRENSKREAQELEEASSPTQTREDHEFFKNLEVELLLGEDGLMQSPTGSDREESVGDQHPLEDVQKFSGSSHRYARKLRREASIEKAKRLQCSAPDAVNASEHATTADEHKAFRMEEEMLLGSSPECDRGGSRHSVEVSKLQSFAGSSARIDRKLRRQRSFDEAKELSPTAQVYSRTEIAFHEDNERKEAELIETTEMLEGLLDKIM